MRTDKIFVSITLVIVQSICFPAAIQASGDLFVESEDRLMHFDETGEFLREFRFHDEDLGKFNLSKIAIGIDNDIYMRGFYADHQFTTMGVYRDDLVTEEMESFLPMTFQDFLSIDDMAIDQNGLVYLAATAADRQFLEAYDGATGDLAARIENIAPNDLVFDANGRLTIGDKVELPGGPQFVSLSDDVPNLQYSTVVTSRPIVGDLDGEVYLRSIRDPEGGTKLIKLSDENMSYPVSDYSLGFSFDEDGNVYYVDFFSGVFRTTPDGVTNKLDFPPKVRAGDFLSETAYEPFSGRFSDELSLPLSVRDITRITREVYEGRVRDEWDVDASGDINSSELLQFFASEGVNVGDVDFDGIFNSGDLVNLFRQGHYDAAALIDSEWSDGDFNGDRAFNSSDLALAFQAGNYEVQPVADTLAVPEPTAFVYWCLGLLAVMSRQRRPR